MATTGKAFGAKVLGATGAVAALAALNATAASAGGPLAPMTYPPKVEQGQTFTISGTDCDDDAGTGGRAAGTWDGQTSDWSRIDVAADSNGNWSVQLTVPLGQAVTVDDWDVECVDVPDTRFYPFTSMEVVPAGSLPTTTTTTTTSPVSSSTTAAPTTTAAGAPTVQPAFTG